MAVTGIIGHFCVVAVNAWMNVPTGFRLVDGEVTDVAAVDGDVQRARLAPVRPHVGRRLHGGRLQRRRGVRRRDAARSARRPPPAGVHRPVRLRVRRGAHAAVRRAPARLRPRRAPAGEARRLRAGRDDREPVAAAARWCPGRRRGARLDRHPGAGIADRAELVHEPVPGLDDDPGGRPPPVNLTHLAFQSMVGIGTLLAAGVALFWFAAPGAAGTCWRTRWFLRSRPSAGPLAVVALESGWVATEVGRQPWIVHGVHAHDRRRRRRHLGAVVAARRHGGRLRRDDRGAVSSCGRWPGAGAPARPTCRARTPRRSRSCSG